MRVLNLMLLLLLAVLLHSCSGFAKQETPFDETIQLSEGKTFSTTDGDLTFTFLSVKSDSRCPLDVQCIVAGEVEVELSIQVEEDDPVTFTLKGYLDKDGTEPLVGTAEGVVVQMLRVDPFPLANETVAPEKTAQFRLNTES